MKATYDAKLDILRIVFSDASTTESDEDNPDIILDATKPMSNPCELEYAVVGVKQGRS